MPMPNLGPASSRASLPSVSLQAPGFSLSLGERSWGRGVHSPPAPLSPWGRGVGGEGIRFRLLFFLLLSRCRHFDSEMS